VYFVSHGQWTTRLSFLAVAPIIITYDYSWKEQHAWLRLPCCLHHSVDALVVAGVCLEVSDVASSDCSDYYFYSAPARLAVVAGGPRANANRKATERPTSIRDSPNYYCSSFVDAEPQDGLAASAVALVVGDFELTE
jgi:hypothetical protein